MIQNFLNMRLRIQTITLAASSKSVNLHDLPRLSIHDWDQRDWVWVEVSIGVALAFVVGEDKALEEACVAICFIGTAIGPGFDDSVEAFWKFEFGEGIFEFLGCLDGFDEVVEFSSGRTMSIVLI